MSGTAAVSGIKVPIFAVDNATAVINRVSRNLQGMAQPTLRLTNSLKRMTEPFGVQRLGEGMRSLGSKVLGTARHIERIVPAMAAITGATSLAGIAALENRFANLGQSVANTARRLGIGTDALTSLQGAGRLAGIGADEVTTGLANLDEKLRGAVFRGDPVIQTFNQLAVSVGQIGHHARTADEALDDVADGIKRLYETQGRGAALRAAQNLGLEGMFSFLILGSKGIKAYQEEAKKLGAVMTPEMVKRAESMHRSFARLTLSVEGFANKIGYELQPVIGPFFDWLANKIGSKSGRIAQDIGKLAEKLTHFLMHDVDWKPVIKAAKEFGEWIDKIIRADWTPLKEALKFVADIIERIAGVKEPAGSPDVPSIAGGSGTGTTGATEVPAGENDSWFERQRKKLFPSLYQQGPRVPWQLDPTNPAANAGRYDPYGGQKSYDHSSAAITVPTAHTPATFLVMKQAHDFFASKGLDEDQIAGILTNIAAESGFDPNRWGDNYTSYGLFQMHEGRMTEMMSRYGMAPSVPEQLEFAYEQWQTQYRKNWEELRHTHGAGNVAGVVSKGFEVAGGESKNPDIEAARRAGAAQPFVGAVDITVNIHDHKTTAKATGEGAVNVRPVKVTKAMPAMGF
jgi:hypothetical protein